MDAYMNSDDLQKIEKSNKAFAVLSTLPAPQRTILLEGLVAAMQLSKNDSPTDSRNAFIWDWWLTSDE